MYKESHLRIIKFLTLPEEVNFLCCYKCFFLVFLLSRGDISPYVIFY